MGIHKSPDFHHKELVMRSFEVFFLIACYFVLFYVYLYSLYWLLQYGNRFVVCVSSTTYITVLSEVQYHHAKTIHFIQPWFERMSYYHTVIHQCIILSAWNTCRLDQIDRELTKTVKCIYSTENIFNFSKCPICYFSLFRRVLLTINQHWCS